MKYTLNENTAKFILSDKLTLAETMWLNEDDNTSGQTQAANSQQLAYDNNYIKAIKELVIQATSLKNKNKNILDSYKEKASELLTTANTDPVASNLISFSSELNAYLDKQKTDLKNSKAFKDNKKVEVFNGCKAVLTELRTRLSDKQIEIDDLFSFYEQYIKDPDTGNLYNKKAIKMASHDTPDKKLGKWLNNRSKNKAVKYSSKQYKQASTLYDEFGKEYDESNYQSKAVAKTVQEFASLLDFIQLAVNIYADTYLQFNSKESSNIAQAKAYEIFIFTVTNFGSLDPDSVKIPGEQKSNKLVLGTEDIKKLSKAIECVVTTHNDNNGVSPQINTLATIDKNKLVNTLSLVSNTKPTTTAQFKSDTTKDWDALYKRSQDKTAFWKNYYLKVWGDDAEKINLLGGKGFREDCITYGFSEESNPMIEYLREYAINRQWIERPNIYALMHEQIKNKQSNGYLKIIDFTGEGILKKRNIIFCEEFYKLGSTSMKEYLECQSLIMKETIKNESSDKDSTAAKWYDAIRDFYTAHTKDFSATETNKLSKQAIAYVLCYNIDLKSETSVFENVSSQESKLQLRPISEVKKLVMLLYGAETIKNANKFKVTDENVTGVIENIINNDAALTKFIMFILAKDTNLATSDPSDTIKQILKKFTIKGNQLKPDELIKENIPLNELGEMGKKLKEIGGKIDKGTANDLLDKVLTALASKGKLSVTEDKPQEEKKSESTNNTNSTAQ